MGIIIAQNGDDVFETMKQRLLIRPGGGSTYALNTLCQKRIGDEFTEDAINNARFLVINLNDRNEILGFATVMYYLDDSDTTYLYIELICNAPGHFMALRSNVNRAGAKAMIESIEQLAMDMDCSYVKLSAIDQVVPYYFRLGFNFISVVNPEGEINTVLQGRSADLVQKLRDGQLDDDKEEQEQAMVKIIQRFYPGYLNENYQGTLYSKVGRSRTGPAREQGIPMIKWLNTGRAPPPVQSELPSQTRPFGGKKTKKRRYKSKSKKNKKKSKVRKQKKSRRSKKSKKSKK
jgi:hypothetical protein